MLELAGVVRMMHSVQVCGFYVVPAFFGIWVPCNRGSKVFLFC
jgi:hypothetical protein